MSNVMYYLFLKLYTNVDMNDNREGLALAS